MKNLAVSSGFVVIFATLTSDYQWFRNDTSFPVIDSRAKHDFNNPFRHAYVLLLVCQRCRQEDRVGNSSWIVLVIQATLC